MVGQVIVRVQANTANSLAMRHDPGDIVACVLVWIRQTHINGPGHYHEDWDDFLDSPTIAELGARSAIHGSQGLAFDRGKSRICVAIVCR
jgi:hypothetical protein